MSAIVSSIRYAVCAIGHLVGTREQFATEYTEARGRSRFRIFGSGFLIADDAVLTSRYVLLRLNEYARRDRLDRKQRLLMFVEPSGGSTQLHMVPFGPTVHVTTPEVDLALIRLQSAGRKPLALGRPLQTFETPRAGLGQPIGAVGYALGEGLLKRKFGDDEMIYRAGPILQRGYISAVAPSNDQPLVTRLLLDLRSHEGMQGCPVFDYESGRVIGVHDGGREELVQFAIPLNAQRVRDLLAYQVPAPGVEGRVQLTHVLREPEPG